MLERDGQKRNCVLFHICDDPAHGEEFNEYQSPKQDSYPEGPMRPVAAACIPPGRTKPWMQEATEVLTKLKEQQNVVKYVCLDGSTCCIRYHIDLLQQLHVSALYQG